MSTSCVLHDIKPDVPEDFKPNKSMIFKDVLKGVNFYKIYAEKDGFDVHMNTLRKNGDIIKHMYVMGKPKMNLMERNTIYSVKNCKAKIIMKCVKEMCEYRFDKFQEMHNHNLEYTFHLKFSRSLSYYDKLFILHAYTMKMGATKSYKLKSTLKGDVQHVRGKDVDYRNFKKDMGSSIGFGDTQLIVNNDATLKQVVEFDFFINQSTYCMWHIMKKLPKEVEFLKSMDFKKIFINLFNLEDERWFNDIFENKEAWVPTYFNDFPRCGLMKTTSRLESINSFFNVYLQIKIFLLNFMMNCDNAIKKQRCTQSEFDHITKVAHYVWKSPRMIEQHTVEAREMDEKFFKVVHKNQKHEVKAMYKM
uniref:Protein FAR1-RELATED SEQUENCE n=1 Tax=Lactuca sativa TaxID=4236 RepID=A0A9R1WAV1_LACSA|nr:hypothetical protein LSAT_V11C200069870 [Lactuca sativa]